MGRRNRAKRLFKTGIALLASLVMIMSLFCLSACSKKDVSQPQAEVASTSFDDVSDTLSTAEDEKAEREAAAAAEAAAQAAAAEAAAAEAAKPETASGIVVIDAGHQARGDSSQEPVGPGASETKARVSGGASGAVTGNPEGEVNLEVALKLQAALEARGVTVVMCRTSQDVNMSNSERAAIANENNASLFIRLHCDGASAGTSGFLTLIPGENQWTGPIVAESSRAADIMHPIILSETGANDRGITPRTDLSGFNWCEVPTVLFEMGNMANAAEDEALGSESYQQTLADAMADATVAYLQTT